MKQKLMEDVIQQMLPHLNNAQLQKLQRVLEHALYSCCLLYTYIGQRWGIISPVCLSFEAF